MPVTFPSIEPTARNFTAPTWFTTTQLAQAGVITRRIWGSKPGQASLSLQFGNITDDNVAAILEAYDTAQGPIDAVTLPSIIFNGADAALQAWLTQPNLQWGFDERSTPQVESVAPGRSNVQITLAAYLLSFFTSLNATASGTARVLTLTLASGAAESRVAAAGISEAVSLILAPGTVSGTQGTLEMAGIAEAVILTLTPGAPENSAAVVGVAEIVTLTLTPGVASSTGSTFDIAGIAEAVALALNPGAASSAQTTTNVTGINETIAFALTPGVASGTGGTIAVSGITETVTLTLTPGVAIEGVFPTSDYWSDWVAQNYGWESLFLVEWWGS